jgi:hypothetical protein
MHPFLSKEIREPLMNQLQLCRIKESPSNPRLVRDDDQAKTTSTQLTQTISRTADQFDLVWM